MADAAYHVASFVVHVKPEHADEAVRMINALDGLEVHAAEGGKLVVTAEGTGVREIAQLKERLEASGPVLAVAPVYHEYDEPSD